MKTIEECKELDRVKYRYNIQCLDKQGKLGCFITNRRTGKQVTETYKDSFELFTSEEYINLKR